MIPLTKSEKKILAKIKKWLSPNHKPYMFWFIYNENDNHTAINWEGGTELSKTPQFRNQYTIEYGKKLVKNW